MNILFVVCILGWSVNHYDLSTRYASTLVAMTSSFGTLGAILVPLVVGAFTSNHKVWECKTVSP